jgi:muconate cycloisomerase
MSATVTDIKLTPFRTRRRTGSISTHIAVEVQTNGGVVGVGEISDLDCYRLTPVDVEGLRVSALKVIAGQDVARIVEFHQKMMQHAQYLTSLYSYPPFSMMSQTVAGLEMALYDAYGKILGIPVHDLLGGKVRDHIEMTYPLFPAASEADVVANAAYVDVLMAKGVTCYRYYAGVNHEADRHMLDTLRARHPNIRLKSLDYQGRLYWKDALKSIESLLQYDFEMVEGPSWKEDYEGLRRVRDALSIDVCEHVSSYVQARRLLEAGAVDVFNITHQSAGMWGALRLFGLAEAFGIKCLVSTTQETSLGTAAVAHLGAVVPRLDVPGDAIGPLLYLDDVTTTPIRYDNGNLVVPDGPGLGVEIDHDALRRLQGPLIEWDAPAHAAGYVGR